MFADIIVGRGVGGWSVAEIAIAVVVIAAVLALVFVALKEYGINMPPWVVQVFWILVVAVVVILAIRLVAGI